ncbi:unnamed protein product [Linum trigynum]|uniref:Uncharacterized protein n=1 Tax=Linum trigynum TaxID=586398 RepID=A0AAV2G4G5_9ROSI
MKVTQLPTTTRDSSILSYPFVFLSLFTSLPPTTRLSKSYQHPRRHPRTDHHLRLGHQLVASSPAEAVEILRTHGHLLSARYVPTVKSHFLIVVPIQSPRQRRRRMQLLHRPSSPTNNGTANQDLK